jgi:16S rRNA (uracil1498-N3)-methyltransferase
LARAVLTHTFKDICEVEIVERVFQNNTTSTNFHLAVAPTKNPDRMEWMVEKAVEIGVSQITFIICDRSERKHVDLYRLQRIAIAALKQSQGTWLPKLKTVSFQSFINENRSIIADKYIAYCDDKTSAVDISNIKNQQKEVIFLIGPEGDFTSQEVVAAKEAGFQQVTLGEKTLRTETAGIFVVCWFAMVGARRALPLRD